MSCPRDAQRVRDRPTPAWPSASDVFIFRQRPPWAAPTSDAELAKLVHRDELAPILDATRRGLLETADRAYREARGEPRRWSNARAAYARFVAASTAGGPLRAYAEYRLAQTLWNSGKHAEAMAALAQLSKHAVATSSEPGAAELMGLAEQDRVVLHAEASDAPTAYRALSGRALDALGQAYLDRGRFGEAERLYELVLADAPGERRCEIQARLTEVKMVVGAHSASALKEAASAQINGYRAFRQGAASTAAKRQCARVTVGQLTELAAASQVEVVGSDGVKGTGDRRTAELARTLQRWLGDDFEARELDELTPLPSTEPPLSSRLRLARADLLAFLQEWEECGPLYDREAELATGASGVSRAALGAAHCYAGLAHQERRHREPAKSGDAIEALTSADQRLLASTSRYLCSTDPTDADPLARSRRIFAELARARVYYERRQLGQAVVELGDAALAGPGWDDSTRAAQLELEALAALRSNELPDPCRQELDRMRPRLLQLHCSGEPRAADSACEKLRAVGAARLGGPREGARRAVPRPPTLDYTSVSGSTLPATTLRIVRLHAGQLDACYQGALRRNEGLAGQIEIDLEIGRDGNVRNARAQPSPLGDRALIACVVGVFSSMKFHQPEGGVPHVRYALDLGPAHGVTAPTQIDFHIGE